MAGEQFNPADLTRLADRFARDAPKVFGVTLDFSPQSLMIVDQIVETKFRRGKEAKATTPIPFAAYVGEVIRRNIGGRWVLRDGVVGLESIGKIDITYPMGKSAKRFKFGMQ